MADRQRVDALFDRILAAPPSSPERADAIAELIVVLDEEGAWRRWVNDLISLAPDSTDAAEEYRAVGVEAAFAYLSAVGSIDADNRVGVLYQVARRAVMRQSQGSAGIAGLRALHQRRNRYRQLQAELQGDLGRAPTRAEVFAAAEAVPARQGERRDRLVASEAGLYEGSSDVSVTIDAVEQTLQAGDIADAAAAALDALRTIRAVVDTIIASYREHTGLLWFAMVLAESRQRSSGPDNIAKVAMNAGMSTQRARRYHDLIRSHPHLDDAVSSGANGQIIAVAMREAPDELGLVTWSRNLLKEVMAVAPGEVGLLSYARSWLTLAAENGRTPRGTDVARNVEASTGVKMSERQMRGYSRALSGVLDQIRAADGVSDANRLDGGSTQHG